MSSFPSMYEFPQRPGPTTLSPFNNESSRRRAAYTERGVDGCVQRRCAYNRIIFISIYDKIDPLIARYPRRQRRTFWGISVSLSVSSIAYDDEQQTSTSNRRSTLPHTDCKLLCYNFLSINWLSLLVFLSTRSVYLIVLLHINLRSTHGVMPCTTPFIFLSDCFSFSSLLQTKNFVRISFFLSFFFLSFFRSSFLSFRFVLQIDERHIRRV